MLKTVEEDGILEIHSITPVGQRMLFILLALFPLIAPYELIIQPRWESILNFFFLFAALISLGAISISALLVWAAIAGLNFRIAFDRQTRLFTYTFSAPVLPRRVSQHSFDSIEQFRIDKQDWSEGRPSYTLHIVLKDASALKIGSSSVRHELDAITADIHTFLEK